MKQVQIMQISNGWVVSYPEVTEQNGQLVQQPVSIYCRDSEAVAGTVQRLCQETEKPTLHINQ